MIDVDASLWVEYDDGNYEPIALIEIARDVGQPHKSSTVTKNLARRAGLLAYVVLYKVGNSENPAIPTISDISSFRVKCINPSERADIGWKPYTPQEYANFLVDLRKYSGMILDGGGCNIEISKLVPRQPIDELRAAWDRSDAQTRAAFIKEVTSCRRSMSCGLYAENAK